MLVVCFGLKKRSLLHKCKGNFALRITRNLQVDLQFSFGRRILLRPDVLCAMRIHPVTHVDSLLIYSYILKLYIYIYIDYCILPL
jgi:hypothetical protein